MKKGGSIASNSVVGLANSNVYKQMNNAASNKVGGKCSCNSKLHGGSQASSSVTNLVDAPTYSAMNLEASNRLNSAKCADGGAKKAVKKCQKCPKCHVTHRKTCPKTIKKGGSGDTDLASNRVFDTHPVSEAAPAFDYGVMKAGTKGGSMFMAKNINDLNTNSYSIRNKKGGDSAGKPFTIGLDYSVIPNTSHLHGAHVDRSTSSAVLQYMADQSPITSTMMNKTVDSALGGVVDTTSPFSYARAPNMAGGKSKKKTQIQKRRKNTKKT